MITNRRMRLSDAEAIYRAARLKLIEELIGASNEYRGSSIVLRHQHATERQALVGLLNHHDVDRWREIQVVALRSEAGQFELLVEGGIRPGLHQPTPWLFGDSVAAPEYVGAFEWEVQCGPLGATLETHPVSDPFAMIVMNIVAWMYGAIEQIDEALTAKKTADTKCWNRIAECVQRMAEDAGGSNQAGMKEATLELFGPVDAEKRRQWLGAIGRDPEGMVRVQFAALLEQAEQWARSEARAPRRRIIAFRQSLATMCEHLESQLRHLANLQFSKQAAGVVPVSWRDASHVF